MMRTIVRMVALCLYHVDAADCVCSSSDKIDGACKPLPKCYGDPFCSTIQNRCQFPIWARVAYGSPEGQISTRRLEPGEHATLELLSNLPQAKGARLYLYYKEPPYVPENASAATYQHFTQLLEFTTHQRDGVPMIDYDISGVDAAAFPVYMNVYSDDHGRFCGPVGSFKDLASFSDGCPTEEVDDFMGQRTCNGAFIYCLQNPDSEFCAKMNVIASKLNVSSSQIYGCQLDEAKGFTREVCQRINLGLCNCIEDRCKDCDMAPSDDPSTWFKIEPHNSYAQWLMKRGSYYSFSLFDYEANKQCLGTQLDIIACPYCEVIPPSPSPAPRPPSPKPVPSFSCCSKCTGFPDMAATCEANPFYCEPRCLSGLSLGCNADGKHQECRFCGRGEFPPCPRESVALFLL